MVPHRIPVESWKSKNGSYQAKSQRHKPDIRKVKGQQWVSSGKHQGIIAEPWDFTYKEMENHIPTRK
jgi:hypothetical protein